MDLQKAFDDGFDAVKGYIDRSFAQFEKRLEAQATEIAELKKRAPEKGEPGCAGKDGVDGRDGEQGPSGADGRDGVDGKDGVNGEAGAPGEKGVDGKDGRDGVGLAGAVIDRGGNLILTLTDGTTRDLGGVIGKDGRDGKDGERGPAGFTLADFDTEFRHADKTLVLKFAAGDTLETHEIFLPYVRDVGVWKEGAAYLEGDGVTWGGSFWTAQKDTTAKPDGSDDWRLAVKRGRDGKDFAGPQVKAPTKVKV